MRSNRGNEQERETFICMDNNKQKMIIKQHSKLYSMTSRFIRFFDCKDNENILPWKRITFITFD